MKKSERLSINIIIVTTIALLVLIFIVGYFNGGFSWQKFNPATDVCERDCITVLKEARIALNSREGLSSDTSLDEEFDICTKNWKRSWADTEVLNECINWHPKNKCELNPEAEGCVCDEYNQERHTQEIQVYHYTVSKWNKNLINEWRIDLNESEYGIKKVNLSRDCERIYIDELELCKLNTTSMTLSCDSGCTIRKWKTETLEETSITGACIRSHLPQTPIKIDLDKEKCDGWTNESVVIINKWIRPVYCAEEQFNKKSLSYNQYCCIRKEPKTISDLSCEELRKEYDCHFFFSLNRCITMTDQHMVLFEYIDRCGGIKWKGE